MFIWDNFSELKLRWVYLLFIVVGASSCVTSGVKSPEAERYSEMIAKNCVTETGVSSYVTKYKITQEVEVFSIINSKNGWTIIDAAVSGIRDNIYHNKDRSIFVCGATHFRSKGYVIER